MTQMEIEETGAQAIEILFKQCVLNDDGVLDTEMDDSTIAHFLAQGCKDADKAVQRMSYDDVARDLAEMIEATKTSLREISQHIRSIAEDPVKVQALTDQVQLADMRALEHMAENEVNEHQILVVTNPNENVTRALMVADSMCTILDNALSSITEDELQLAAHLSLNLARELLQAGQTLFLSFADEGASSPGEGNWNSDRFEEILEEDKNVQFHPGRRDIHEFMRGIYVKICDNFKEHPFVSGTATVAALPFIGLVIPVASIIGSAWMIEKYYPEYTSLVIDMCSNFVKMMNLWMLLLKISIRHLGLVAKECCKSWYEYASEHGFLVTAQNAASACFVASSFAASQMYQLVISSLQK